GHRLASRVEEAKIALSETPQTEFRYFSGDVQLASIVELGELQQSIAGATSSIASTIESTVKSAGVSGADIHTLILTGGSTRVPAVSNVLRAQFPAARAVETDAFGSVGLGLALDAARRF